MKISFKTALISFVAFLLFLSLAVTWVAPMAKITPIEAAILLTAVVVLSALIKVKNRPGVYKNAIQVEIWVNYIIERLWKDNAFLKYAWNDDDKVLAGKVVHIPNPGAAPVITKNRSSFPATAVRRTDTDITYSLDEYTTAPSHIEDAEMVESSYDKMSSVIGDHIGYLTENVADNLLLSWLDESVTAPVKMYTSGAAVPASVDEIEAVVTGNRKALTALDVKRVMTQFNLQKIPKIGRYALLESNMLDQLMTDLSVTQYRDFSASVDPANGVIGKLYGFTFLDRSSTIIYNAANALKSFGAAGATDDNLASIFWHQDAVTRALGEVKMFENIGRAEYYGNVISALLRMGGRRRRADDKGVIAMIQSPSA
jgi:hypothetical protein